MQRPSGTPRKKHPHRLGMRRGSSPTGRALDEAKLSRPANDFGVGVAEHSVESAVGSGERTELARLGSKTIALVTTVVRLRAGRIGETSISHEPRLIVAAEENLDRNAFVARFGD